MEKISFKNFVLEFGILRVDFKTFKAWWILIIFIFSGMACPIGQYYYLENTPKIEPTPVWAWLIFAVCILILGVIITPPKNENSENSEDSKK